MAVGKRNRLKLKLGARLRLSSVSVQEGVDIKESINASALGASRPVPMESAPEPSPINYDHRLSDPTHNHTMPHATTPLITSRRRKSSRESKNASIKRSQSTPNVRGLSEANLSAAERRRNKLGYHRTSVACGHCRRRKIRCLLAPDDKQNRCSNCIRLKKECNFFPVDQQPQIERRPRPVTKAEPRTGDGGMSSASSPAMAGGHMMDHVQNFNHYPPLPVPAQDYPLPAGPLSASTLSPSHRGPTSSRMYDYSLQSDRPQWSPAIDNVPPSASLSSPEETTYWRIHDSPMTPNFPAHFQGPPTSVAHQPHEVGGGLTSFAAPRIETGWSAPRSMSFGQIEDLHSTPHGNYPYAMPMDFRRRFSDMNPPSLQTSNNSSNTSIPEGNMTPLSAPAVSSPPPQHNFGTPLSAPAVSSPPMHSFDVAHAWNTLPGHHLTKPPDVASWYSEAPLPKVQEEDTGSFYDETPGGIYSSPGP